MYISIRIIYRACAADLLNEPESGHRVYSIAYAINFSYI